MVRHKLKWTASLYGKHVFRNPGFQILLSTTTYPGIVFKTVLLCVMHFGRERRLRSRRLWKRLFQCKTSLVKGSREVSFAPQFFSISDTGLQLILDRSTCIVYPVDTVSVPQSVLPCLIFGILLLTMRSIILSITPASYHLWCQMEPSPN